MLKCLLSVALLVAACYSVSPRIEGSGVAGSEQREVAAFTELATSGSFAVEVEVGPAPGVRIEADDNLLSNITTEVSGELLRISSRNGYNTSRAILVRVTTPRLVAVEHAGSGSVQVQGITGERFTAGLYGSGMMRLAGQADALVANVDGAGQLEAAGLHTRSATVSLAGSGRVDVHATEKVVANVSGTGLVRHAGGATDVVRAIAGTGAVTRM